MMFNAIPAIITVINGNKKMNKSKSIKKLCAMCKQEKDYGDFPQDFDNIEPICYECQEELRFEADYDYDGRNS